LQPGAGSFCRRWTLACAGDEGSQAVFNRPVLHEQVPGLFPAASAASQVVLDSLAVGSAELVVLVSA
jgi:hypothetical protein